MRSVPRGTGRSVAERLDSDEKGVSSIHTPGGLQSVSVINESGLYSLILGSRKPEAKKFKKWVTSEVLPAIRKTGAYRQPETERHMLDGTDGVYPTDVELAKLSTVCAQRHAQRVIYWSGKSQGEATRA